MELATIQVRFKEKKEMGVVQINEADFDSKLHVKAEDEGDPWTARKKELQAMSADGVREVTDELEIEYTNKRDAIEAILEAEFEDEG